MGAYGCNGPWRRSRETRETKPDRGEGDEAGGISEVVFRDNEEEGEGYD